MTNNTLSPGDLNTISRIVHRDARAPLVCLIAASLRLGRYTAEAYHDNNVDLYRLCLDAERSMIAVCERLMSNSNADLDLMMCELLEELEALSAARRKG